MPVDPPRTAAQSPSVERTPHRRRAVVVLTALALPLAGSLVVAPAASAAPKAKTVTSTTTTTWSASSWSARAWAASSWSSLP